MYIHIQTNIVLVQLVYSVVFLLYLYLYEPDGDVPLNGVAFSIELLECGRTFLDFWGKKVLHIYG